MAFDLLFFKNKNQDVYLNDVIAYFDALPNFTSQTYDDINYNFVYFNERTNVYFIFNYNEGYKLEQPLEFDDYEFSNLVFTINYIRPTFYAYEAMPIVEEFAKTFNLMIYNPQVDTPRIQLYSSDDLISSWAVNNQTSCKVFNEQMPLKILPIEKANYAYNYLNEYENIQKTLGDDFIVPKMQYLKDLTTNDVYTAITWNDAIPIVLPKCDFVIILKEVKTFFGLMKKQVPSVIEYDTIVNEFKDIIVPYQSNISDLLIMPLENEQKAREVFYRIVDVEYEDLESVNADDFIDATL